MAASVGRSARPGSRRRLPIASSGASVRPDSADDRASANHSGVAPPASAALVSGQALESGTTETASWINASRGRPGLTAVTAKIPVCVA